ncbi:D-glycerate dehydrogenase [Deferribacter autotrophicus]|uniref:D-glycerate dehydrogenase n=1 Tax=Deferribacter autotrophicus TaxID=500465 RepID=A0A5A8F7M5_9BACT|nr:D-glycerate dehydrogenase [Deferribacter autotrophicus]KAA0259068.1 D-glycerate dehydrogenase [Deferribacter autotrophicus]
MKVLITQKLPFNVEEYLKDFELDYRKESTPIPYEELYERGKSAHGIISMLSDKIDKNLLENCPNLKVVANYAVGYNNIDVAFATQKGIVVCNTPDVLTETTAELAFALMISIARRIVEADNFTREGKFTGWSPELYLGTDLFKKTVGLYGFGRIGQAFARCCKGFEMDIIYHTRNRNLQAEILTGAKYVSFDELLEKSDFIVIIAPLNDESYHKFTINAFKKMKNSAYLINIGRGPIVKEDDLVTALKEGLIKGAGLDVYEFEPKIHPELFNLKNVILLPHIGSASVKTRAEMAKLCADSIISVLKFGKKPKNALN